MKFPRILAPTLLLLLVVFPWAGLLAAEPGHDELDAMETAALEQLLVLRPELEEQLDKLPGYAVIAMTTTKIPGVGTGVGYGVVIDNRSELRSYIKVTQFEVGGGLGAQKFKTVILFKGERQLERIISGGWRQEAGTDFSTGTNSSEAPSTVSSKSGKGYEVFKLDESGALATITIRLLRAQPYLAD